VPAGEASSREWIDPGAFALIGVAAFFGGVARITMAVTVIITEISNDTHFILPIMASIMVGKWVADYTGVHPIYHALMAKKGLPYMHATPHTEAPLDVFVAGQVATPEVVTLTIKNTVPEIAHILLQCKHNAFPVIVPAVNGGPGGMFLGLVRREHLVGILKTPKLWENTESKGKNLWHRFKVKALSSLGSDELSNLEMKAFDAPEELASRAVDEDLIKLGRKVNDKYEVDLKPYIDRGAFTVQETFSLLSTYTMFRSMGLRHVVVVDGLNHVVGIITRHNLVEANLQKLLTVEKMRSPDEVLELTQVGSDSDGV
jgi:chloride channel 7